MPRGRRKRGATKSSNGVQDVSLSTQVDKLNSPARKENRIDHTMKIKPHNPVKTRNLPKSTVRITSFFPTQAKDVSNEDPKKEETFPIMSNKCFIKKEEPDCIDSIQNDIVSDAGEFKTDETPVAVPIHSSSTPHRINMPNTESEDINQGGTNFDDDKKPLFNVLSSQIKQENKKLGIRGRKKLNLNQIGNSLLTETTNHKLTDYFPVRRSVRKCKKTVMEEKQREMQNKVIFKVEDGLEIRHFPGKGRGIVTTREFAKGEFVVEYIGELIDQITAKKRELLYAQDQSTGCYMYYFQHRNHQYCVDATAETDKLGRLVNHSRNGNLIARVIEVESVPHLVLTAKEDIPIGVEVAYDYGDRSREAIRNHPWLAL